MARNGGGAYSIPVTLASGAEILSAPHNQNYSDLASEMTNSLALDGQSTMTGAFKAANGTLGAPSDTFGTDLDTGRYHKAADTMADVCGGAEVQEISTTGVAVTGTHSASGLSSGLGHVPVGAVTDYAGSAAPTGWLICNGASLLRASYAALFTAIGTTFGAADGTHFTLPDCTGRVIAGKESSATRLTAAASGVDGGTLGAVGGEQTHALIIAEHAAHTHTSPAVNDPGHIHTTTATRANQAGGGLAGGSQYTQPDGVVASNTTGITLAATTGSSGSGTAHNNVQPTIVMNKIIFAGV